MGGFLQFLVPAAIGMATSLFGGSGMSKSKTVGSGLRLRTGNGLYLKKGKNLYDITDEPKYGSGFLSGILKVLPMIAKKVLPALGLGALSGASSEGASQIIKKNAGRKGNGIYLQTEGGQIYDLTDTKEGAGLLSELTGANFGPLSKIPLLGALF